MFALDVRCSVCDGGFQVEGWEEDGRICPIEDSGVRPGTKASPRNGVFALFFCFFIIAIILFLIPELVVYTQFS